MSKANNAIRCASEAGYRTRKDGSIISPKGRNLKLHPNSAGYLTFSTKQDGRTRNVPVHRLVAYEKYGDVIFKNGVITRHLSGDKLDNRRSNISIGTYSQNRLDMPRHIRLELSINAASKLRKLSARQLTEFRKDREKGASLNFLASKYKISKCCASYVVNGKTYQNS